MNAPNSFLDKIMSLVPGGKSLKDPKWFVHDESAPPLYRDFREDLMGSNVPLSGTGRYIIGSYTVPDKSILAVKGFVPYAMQRINPGAADESFQMINPIDGNGFFSFTPYVNNSVTFNANLDYNAPQLATGTAPVQAPNDKLRQQRSGISFLSLDPWGEAQRQWQNPLFTFTVPSSQTLQVIFEVLPPSATNPLPVNGRYTIGAAAVKRVDFAGVVIVGQQMTEQHYKDLKRRVQAGEP